MKMKQAAVSPRSSNTEMASSAAPLELHSTGGLCDQLDGRHGPHRWRCPLTGAVYPHSSTPNAILHLIVINEGSGRQVGEKVSLMRRVFELASHQPQKNERSKSKEILR